MSVDLSKFGIVSEKKYGGPLDDPVCVCGFEKALSAGQLIDFGDPVRLEKGIAYSTYPHASLAIAEWSLSSS